MGRILETGCDTECSSGCRTSKEQHRAPKQTAGTGPPCSAKILMASWRP
jgi:hypothetical protein